MRANKPLLHGDVTASIIDSFFEVYKELGYGYREYIYTRAPGATPDREKDTELNGKFG